jgi:isopentenyl diphosphate isomerase/L-lactate dehydrogenase-like FMN-dependent dehydrogenase
MSTTDSQKPKEKTPQEFYLENMDQIEKLRNRIVPNINEAINLNEIERLAISKVPLSKLSYYISGANDEYSLRRNKEYFHKIHIIPRVFVDVSKANTRTKILGNPVTSPIFIAPTALHKILNPEGEVAVARAAQEFGTIMTLSHLSSTPIEEVAKANGDGVRWFQLYVIKETIIKRAEKAGCTGLVITVDAPILGFRDRDIQIKFSFQDGLKNNNMIASDKKELTGNEKKILDQGGNRSELFKFFVDNMDSSTTWDIIKWVRSISKLPIILKGIHHPEDALLAEKHGVDAIIVSNHGARQLDTVPSGIEMLYPICKALKGSKMEIYVDGGFRRGTDVFKALAMGAKAVLIGRPALWGLAANGKDGVKRVLDLLNNELLVAMKLAGCSSVDQINESYIKVKGSLARF